MKDIRDMRRSDWHRILERKYTVSPCDFLGMEGVVSLLQIQKVTEPLMVSGENGEKVLIADKGFSWLQVAFREQFFWATVMFDNQGKFLQAYFDITAGNTFEDMNNPKFRDMYLDLVLLEDGRILVLDRDELDEALEQKEITEDEYGQTVKEGDKLQLFLQKNGKEFLNFCREWRKIMLEEVQ
jgi:predicted RNA-binding protein associated with RNAse of E/G family